MSVYFGEFMFSSIDIICMKLLCLISKNFRNIVYMKMYCTVHISGILNWKHKDMVSFSHWCITLLWGMIQKLNRESHRQMDSLLQPRDLRYNFLRCAGINFQCPLPFIWLLVLSFLTQQSRLSMGLMIVVLYLGWSSRSM